MTRGAGYARMFSAKGKFRLVMIEGIALPVLRGVTAVAIGQLSAMLILVAVRAIRTQPEIGLLQHRRSLFPYVGSLDILGVVAFPALKSFVPPFQNKAGLFVLER